MADITIKINTDNDAFYDDASAEVARILRYLVSCLEYSCLSDSNGLKLKDINGNTAGSVSYK